MRNPLSIEAFADWCEKQPEDEWYKYMDCAICACGQYAASLGITADQWRTVAVDNPDGFWFDADKHASPGPHTFGALAQRLRAQP